MNLVSDSFVISSSEAVLLGRTLGEYLEADVDDGGPVSFLHFLWTRLCPFYPVMDRPHVAASANYGCLQSLLFNRFIAETPSEP